MTTDHVLRSTSNKRTNHSSPSNSPVITTPVGANAELLEPLDERLIYADASKHALAERIR